MRLTLKLLLAALVGIAVVQALNGFFRVARERELFENELAHDLKAQGKFLSANPLQPVSTATSVRMREGKRTVTDGPFAETREQLGGYYLIEAKDLDEASKIAARIPSARIGSIEIRPILRYNGDTSTVR